MHAVEDWSDTLLIHEVEHTLKAAAEQWGHVAYDEYTPFASLVPLLPASVQAQADQLVQAVPHKRMLIGADYAHAAWQLMCAGIEALRPAADGEDPFLAAVHAAGAGRPGPAGLRIPRLWARYSILYLKYVTKTHTNKELAALCAIAVRQVITLRNHGLAEVAQRLVAWEQQGVYRTAPRVHLDAPRQHLGGAEGQQHDSRTAVQQD